MSAFARGRAVLRQAAVRLAIGTRTWRAPESLLPLRVLVLRTTMPQLFSQGHLVELLQRLSSERKAGVAAEVLAGATARFLRPVGPWRTTCLYRSLTRYALFRAAGVEVSFVIGVRVAGEELLAHAWLEKDGAPYHEPKDSTRGYEVAFVYPPPQGTAAFSQGEPAMGALRTSKDVLLTELKDGTGVLLDLKTKFYFTLNRTGVFVWKKLAAGEIADEATAAEALAAAFKGVDPTAAREDVSKLIKELEGEGLVAKAA